VANFCCINFTSSSDKAYLRFASSKAIIVTLALSLAVFSLLVAELAIPIASLTF